MIPYFSYTIIELGPVTLNIWGILVALGFLIAFFLAKREIVTKKKILDLDSFTNLVLYVFLVSIIGARIGWLLEHLDIVKQDWSYVYKIWLGGLSLYGGLLFGMAMTYIYARWKKVDIKKLFNVLAIPVTAGLMIGRIGCFLIMDHWGKTTYLPWSRLDIFGISRHPIALYLIVAHWLFLGFLMFVKPKLMKNRRLNQVLKNDYLLFLIYYPLMRIILDSFRVKKGFMADWNWQGFSVAQMVSMVFLLGVIGFLIYIKYVRERINNRKI